MQFHHLLTNSAKATVEKVLPVMHSKFSAVTEFSAVKKRNHCRHSQRPKCCVCMYWVKRSKTGCLIYGVQSSETGKIAFHPTFATSPEVTRHAYAIICKDKCIACWPQRCALKALSLSGSADPSKGSKGPAIVALVQRFCWCSTFDILIRRVPYRT